MADTKIASDGLPALVIKQHSLEKFHYFQRYIYQFTTALKPKPSVTTGFRGFKERNYIDLFCGTGLCILDEIDKEEKGSALIAATIEYPFSNYYFVDANEIHLNALSERVERLGTIQEKKFYLGNANEKVREIIREIDTNISVNLAIADGFGLECHWSTIELLAHCKRMDLIILFPQGMDINRNLFRLWVEEEANSLDLFFGTDKWREIYEDNYGMPKRCIRAFLDLYEENLRQLGYGGKDQVCEQLITGQDGQKLYYLIFASRSELGRKFCKQTLAKSRSGQRRLFD